MPEVVVAAAPPAEKDDVSAGENVVAPAPAPAPAPSLPLPLDPAPEDPDVGFALGMGTRPTSPPEPDPLPLPEAGDVGCAVTNVTCGTVTADVKVDPDAVCVNVTVVTGNPAGGAVLPPLSPEMLGLGPLPAPLVIVPVCVTTVPVSVTVVAGGVGTSVMELGTPVQMPGFWGTKSAQMPAR